MNKMGSRRAGKFPAISAETARRMDEYASAVIGIPSLILMENAAVSISAEALALLDGKDSVCVFCGKGNNGGDGFAAARQLLTRGKKPAVFLAAGPEEIRADAQINLAALLKLGGCPVYFAGAKKRGDILERTRSCGLVIDALLGTGIKGNVSGIYAEMIDIINSSGAPVLSVDVPSGLNADDGSIMGECVEAAVTVTFPAAKRGMFLKDGPRVCGKIVSRDLGVPLDVLMKGVKGSNI